MTAEPSNPESPVGTIGMATRPLLPVSVGVHVYPDTPVRVRLHPDEDRVVLILGDAVACPTILDIYLPRTELVVLRDTLTTALAHLDTAHNTGHDAALAGDADSDGRTDTLNVVRTPAA